MIACLIFIRMLVLFKISWKILFRGYNLIKCQISDITSEKFIYY
jgi:hypothetical protein